MPKPSYHIFICTNERPPGHPKGSCGQSGSREIMNKIDMGIEQRGLFGKVFLTASSCMGPCSMGPVLVVYPDGVWYSKVTPDDVDEILDQHIGKGEKVERLEIPEAMWG
ncbi:MAG: (2Fe-2S) ferredoxin domain-containing protein [Candidatus Nitrohelix vancouverensis]|uniref:(2Fe-2S) ferredoxin domain-containing protein n=1 Tax=Candidatus Nitrohelix vancouverensis TaxID=2705534 RepID=A0A7T0C085_9BACT|nr:MAG: (2Fe-2S) ferredoxin domain-containing protein [Candidatus Nitrohelix vancouverensis]